MATEYHEDYYANLMDKNQDGFLNMLNQNIIKGDKSSEETLKMLRVFCHHPLCQQLIFNFRDNYDDDCLIHNVAKFHQSTNVLKYLLEISPRILLAKRTDRFLGQTALHIVVTKGNIRATRTILKSIQNQEELSTLLHLKATGSLFANTVMMGELAFSVAALTLNTKITDLLLKYGARVAEQNSKGDTVFHSLIRFASIHPEKLDLIINMIEHINAKIKHDHNLVSSVWYNSENNDNLTALKLAASLGQVEIFSSILKFEDVYCKLNHHDGLFDIYLFDITEIDTITQAEWERNKLREMRERKKKSRGIPPNDNFSFKQQAKKKQPAAQSHHPALIHTCPSVLDIICQMPTATAFRLMNVDVVNDVIKTKWRHYRKFYYLWFLIHFLLMSLITAYAVYKTEVINDRIYSTRNSTTHSNDDNFDTSTATERFVLGVSFLGLIYASPYLIYEAFRSFYFKQSWHIEVIHHNGLYRLMLLTMSISLLIDSVLFWIEPDSNYFLIIALLIGWTFMNFFLRALKIFSFFTVMLQKVLLGDMTRFSVIIIFQLIAFSFAMYVTFLNTNPVPDGFGGVGMTMMTMFKLMLGLTDIEVLYQARHPWMAIFLFITCVLVTYVLLINSLIALMSQTCALVSEDRRMQWELQRLSVIHLVETMLFPRWRYLHKPGLKARRYNLDNHASLEWRCFNEITSLQTTYTDGAALFRRKSMIRTIGFGDSGISPMAPFLDRFRVGRNTLGGQMNTLPPIYQTPGSFRPVGTIAEEENQNPEFDSSDDNDENEDESVYHKPETTPTPTTNPTHNPIAVKGKTTTASSSSSSSSAKTSSKSKKQTRLHSSTDNVRGDFQAIPSTKTSKVPIRYSSEENVFSSFSSSNLINDSTTPDGKTKNPNKNKLFATLEPTKSKEGIFLRPNLPGDSGEPATAAGRGGDGPVPPPRKRHNSERVNRKTQTPSQGQGQLSHSYPDGSLRQPLHQINRPSVLIQDPVHHHHPQNQQPTAMSSSGGAGVGGGGAGSINDININPRVVYVVPSAVFPTQQLYPAPRQIISAATPSEYSSAQPENQHAPLHQLQHIPPPAPNNLPQFRLTPAEAQAFPLTDRHPQPLTEHVDDNNAMYAQVVKPPRPSTSRTASNPLLTSDQQSGHDHQAMAPKTVQKLDIESLNSSV